MTIDRFISFVVCLAAQRRRSLAARICCCCCCRLGLKSARTSSAAAVTIAAAAAGAACQTANEVDDCRAPLLFLTPSARGDSCPPWRRRVCTASARSSFVLCAAPSRSVIGLVGTPVAPLCQCPDLVCVWCAERGLDGPELVSQSVGCTLDLCRDACTRAQKRCTFAGRDVGEEGDDGRW